MTDPEPDAYPESWGYKPAPAHALDAAVDTIVQSMTDDEFAAMVARRNGGNR